MKIINSKFQTTDKTFTMKIITLKDMLLWHVYNKNLLITPPELPFSFDLTFRGWPRPVPLLLSVRKLSKLSDTTSYSPNFVLGDTPLNFKGIKWSHIVFLSLPLTFKDGALIHCCTSNSLSSPSHSLLVEQCVYQPLMAAESYSIRKQRVVWK